jgi:hypothetical protein
MNQVTKYVISEFTNPSGEIVFRVSGWQDGKRFRRNFATRAEAQAEKQTLELTAPQGESGMRVAATRLADEQLREGGAAYPSRNWSSKWNGGSSTCSRLQAREEV